jgi:FtsP/CotA-like multicopper oxidase with cupredoxin domain
VLSLPAVRPHRGRRRPTGALPARLGVALLLAAVAGACGGNGPAQSAATTGATATTAPAATASSAATTTREPTTTSTPQGTVVEVRVSGGEVQTAERRVRVRRGERVHLEVVADVAEEVHVHGYDLEEEVAPGRTAVIAFTADLPGVFEVELEGARLRLLQLEVR